MSNLIIEIDAESGELLRTFPRDGVALIGYLPDGGAVGVDDAGIVQRLGEPNSLTGVQLPAGSLVALSRDGRQVIAASRDGTIGGSALDGGGAHFTLPADTRFPPAGLAVGHVPILFRDEPVKAPRVRHDNDATQP